MLINKFNKGRLLGNYKIRMRWQNNKLLSDNKLLISTRSDIIITRNFDMKIERCTHIMRGNPNLRF